MPLDRHASRLLAMLAAGRTAGAPPPSPAERRRSLRDLARSLDDENETVGDIRDSTVPGPAGQIGTRIYTPADAPDGALPGLVFFHGGGWVAGDLDTHDGLCRRLANGSGARVIAVDYRLAPEHPFPAALDDAFAAVAWVAEQAAGLGVDPARLAIGGDSAGGGLAAAACQLAQAHGGPAIAAQLLICPILDAAAESASRLEFAEGFFLDRAAFGQDLADYRPADVDPADPRLSPLRAASLAGLPPAIVHTAEFDPFRDEGEAYANRLASAGVTVRHTRHAGMIHYFYALPAAIPYARRAAEAIGQDLRQILG